MPLNKAGKFDMNPQVSKMHDSAPPAADPAMGADISSDPEAMDALNLLLSKGYTSDDIKAAADQVSGVEPDADQMGGPSDQDVDDEY